MTNEEKKAIEWLKLVSIVATNKYTMKEQLYLKTALNLIEKQENIIDSTKRILYDEELDYCDTLDELYNFYEEVVNNVR